MLKNITLSTALLAVAVLSGCAKTQPAQIIFAPEVEAAAFSAVVQVPKLMRQGSSDISVDIYGQEYSGKMICIRKVVSSSSGVVGSGGGYAVGGSSTSSNVSSCTMTLISGSKALKCEISGSYEDSTSTVKKIAQGVLFLPTLGGSMGLIPDDYTPLGTGECKGNDGTKYSVQVAAPPEE